MVHRCPRALLAKARPWVTEGVWEAAGSPAVLTWF